MQNWSKLCSRHTIEHDRRHAKAILEDFSHVASLFLELTHGTDFGSFARIDQSGRNFDANFVDGRPELLLKQNFGTTGLFEDRYYTNAVDLTVFRSSGPLSGLPVSLAAERILVSGTKR